MLLCYEFIDFHLAALLFRDSSLRRNSVSIAIIIMATLRMTGKEVDELQAFSISKSARGNYKHSQIIGLSS
jgi:hypothetical protein